ncbi:MAG TPA: CsgG/HfaB family protein, partial [Geobacteraceae bacterium]
DTIIWAGYLLYGDPTTRYIDRAEERVSEEQTVTADPGPLPYQEQPRLTVGWAKTDDRSKLPWVLAGGMVLAVLLGSAHYMGHDEQRATAGSSQPTPAAAPQTSSKEMDDLVTSLAASYKSNARPVAKMKEDGWTTPPLTLVFMEMSGPTADSTELFASRLGQFLQAEAGVPLVERQLLLKLLQELKLATSSLADPATALRLGKVLSARLMVTGTLTPSGDGQAVALRFIDTETTQVRKVITSQSAAKEFDNETVAVLGRQIADWLKEEFPVRGTVQAVTGSQCRINLGKSHGLRKGSRLELVQEAGKGTGIYAVTGEAVVQEVEKDSAVAALAGQTAIKQGDKVRVKL